MPWKIAFVYLAIAFLVPVLRWQRQRYVELREDSVRIRANVRFDTPYSNVEGVRRIHPKRLRLYRPNAELALRKPVWTISLVPLPHMFPRCVFELAVEDLESFEADLRERCESRDVHT
jgi:hypothetical protein